MFRTLTLGTVLVVLAAHPLFAQTEVRKADTPSSARPTIRAERISQPPTIDGILDDAAWTTAPIDTGEWRSYSPLLGDKIPQSTKVWVAYDDNYFYFAFK